MYCGYITTLKNLHAHSNADRLLVGECFGNPVIVSTNYVEGQIGVYFPVDGQLSEEFCRVNDLVRRKDENGNSCGGYLDPEKRNIKALKLRGEKSDGLFMPISCLAEFCKVSDLKIGDTITSLGGIEICRKYIPSKAASTGKVSSGNSRCRANSINVPTFYQHVDTAQLAYNLDAFHAGDVVQLTLKMHGTSGRTGFLPVIKHHRSLFDKIFKREGKAFSEYQYVTGTRRVVLDDEHEGGYYKDNNFRHKIAEKFEGKLRKGEVCYYEIVGFQGYNGDPIMATGKVPKEYQNKYGKTMIFSYGCDPAGGYDKDYSVGEDKNLTYLAPCCDVYVYRMTMVNDDGETIEYSPEQIKYRCEQMGIKTVMEFETFIIPCGVNPGDYVVQKVEKYYDGEDPFCNYHVREGVVARILNRNNFAVYKHKNYLFKQITGLAVESLTQEQINNTSEDILEEM